MSCCDLHSNSSSREGRAETEAPLFFISDKPYMKPVELGNPSSSELEFQQYVSTEAELELPGLGLSVSGWLLMRTEDDNVLIDEAMRDDAVRDEAALVDSENEGPGASEDTEKRARSKRKHTPRRFMLRQAARARKLVMCGQGYSLRGARSWIRRTRIDWRVRNYSAHEIRWAHKHGFSAYQVARYGITPQNVGDFISEKDYDLLFPFNGKYDKWLNDRITTLIVAGPFASRFEPVHFNIISRNGELLFIPVSEEARAVAQEKKDALAAFLTFLGRYRKTKELCLNGSAWSNRLYRSLQALPRPKDGNRSYLLGNNVVGRDELVDFLQRMADKRSLVLYEPAPADAGLDALGLDVYGNARIVLFNPTGNDPQIGDAYMRILDDTRSDGLDQEQDAEGATAEAVEHDYDDDDDRAADEEKESAPRLRFYAAPIDLATGTFDGARALYTRGKYIDTPTHVEKGLPLKGQVLHWDEIKRDLIALCKRLPQIEFMEVAVRSTKDGYRIVRVDPSPAYSRALPFSPSVQQFLKGKLADKQQSTDKGFGRARHAAFLRTRRAFTKTFYPAGMVYYQGLRYPHDVIEDLFSRNGIGLGRKLWAYRHGFLSYRLDLYPELCEDNWQNYVTDLEYRWLRHINPKYRTWMEDKITYKYLFSEYPECLPQYYYFTSCRAGENRIVPMMDCPEGYDATVESILRLVREIGVVALKPDEGSHGEGFYKLSYEDGVYALNGEPTTAEHVESILRDPANQYLVSEYIDMHPDLKRIYPGAVNTVRVTVFKRDGVNPQIGNAYFRIGSSRTGAVDNVVAGGLVAEVDVTTGRYGNARTLVDNRIVFEREHPDTGVVIEGELPHWDDIRRKILAIARSVPQLEYLGFDVAITTDGFRLLEVNRYPDYPRISRLTPETISYLLMKIEDKKRFRKVDENPSFFKLPRRDA